MKRLLTLILIVIVVLSFCACEKEEKPTLKEEDIRAVCELATLKCYYNNVAHVEKRASNWFQKDRKMWIEHEGEATIGINMSALVINISGNIITITIPDAEILSIKPNEKSLNETSYVSSEDGWLIKNPITTEDQQQAVTKGQEEMQAAILANAGLFERAERRAKELIENFIMHMGEIIDQEYTIVWKEQEA